MMKLQELILYIIKKICDYCLIETGVIQLSCGCYLCNKHKDLGLSEKCPVCKKEINLID